ncbi:archaeal flagellin n-terminal [Apiospora phragmitis]|uniref:Archaeal flagellin n-terminal n=1 Tax=Apiospora phragmitis TaxID=2905665 RepID=A0ABR1W5J8_9PEZI
MSAGGGINQTAVVPVEATLMAVAMVFVSMRLFLRLGLQRTRLTISDWFIVASALDLVALLATDVMAYNLGGMDDDYDPRTPMEDQVSLLKVSFAGNYFYDSGVYLPKLALLSFYYRLVPPTMPKLHKLLYFTTGLTACFFLTTVFVDTFWCGSDVTVNWNLDGTCSTFDSMTVTRIDWTLNLISDILIFSIPFPLLPGLQINKWYMAGLAATFSSGIITLGTSIGRFATMQVTHAWTNVYVLSMAELVAAVVVVCLPSLKSLVHLGASSMSSSAAKRSGILASTSRTGGTSTSRQHIKLSSGRDPYLISSHRTGGGPVIVSSGGAKSMGLGGGGDDTGSDVELNSLEPHHRSDVIYKSHRVSVTYAKRDDMV